MLLVVLAPSPSARSGFAQDPAYLRFELDLFDPAALSAEARQIAALNETIPAAPEQIIAAKPFQAAFSDDNGLAKLPAIDCLAAAIYYEAAYEPLTGQRAVAQVVLNRVRHAAFPNTVCAVVFQGSERVTGCQFTFTCDGALRRRPSLDGWRRAQTVAAAALSGFVEPSVGYATHYHASYVQPYWASDLTKLTTIGTHIFYRWRGATGAPSAFSTPYGSAEIMPLSAALTLANGALAGNISFTHLTASGDLDRLSKSEASMVAFESNAQAPEPLASNMTIAPTSGIREETSRLAVPGGRLHEQVARSALNDEPRVLLK
jgi:spore germination cell wall hydrolase CwlJ-like protein